MKNVNNFINSLKKSNLYLQKQIEENNLKIDFYKKIKNIKLPEDHYLSFVKGKALFFINYDDFLKILPDEKIYLNKDISLYDGITLFKKIKIDSNNKFAIVYCNFHHAKYDECGYLSYMPEINFSFLSKKQNKRIKNVMIKDISECKFLAKNFKIEDEYIKKMITLQ